MVTDSNQNPNTGNLLDQIEAGLLTREQFEKEIVRQVYAGLRDYCDIPAGYHHCLLATRALNIDALDEESLRVLLRVPPAEIINPFGAHLKAVELFELLLSGDPLVCERGDPLSPTIGAYLHGPPGTGKTHLMAAYGLRVQSLLNEKLDHVSQMLGDVVESAFAQYLDDKAAEVADHETVLLEVKDRRIVQSLSPEEAFWKAVQSCQERVRHHTYQPTDLLYLGFKELVEVFKYSGDRSDAIRALENSRLVFIDDVHPLGDPEQVQIVLQLLERRYELGRAGTFITTNLETKQISGGDEMLGRRLLSRCAETLVSIDFSECSDWRQLVKSRRVKLVEDELDRRIQRHQHVVDDNTE